MPKVQLIIDTDMAGGSCQDADDMGAFGIASALADRGDIEVLAILLDTLPDDAAKLIGVVQRHFGMEDVPVGVYKGGMGTPYHLGLKHAYVTDIAQRWPSSITGTDALPPALDVFRKVLASQPDQSVVIASIGVLTNLAELLQSGPDSHSPLSGAQLVESKVQLLTIMGGRYPNGAECNFCECNLWDHCDSSGAVQAVVSHLPPTLRVIYLGQELGLEVLHGASLSACANGDNPIREAYVQYLGGAYIPRFSWDPLTLLVAVKGPNGVDAVEDCQDCHGWLQLDELGQNNWDYDAQSPQSYMTLSDDASREATTQYMDELLCQTPARLFRELGPSPKASPAVGPLVCFSDPSATGLKLPNAEFNNKGGVWGGTCTCPDGQQYQVGDNGDFCGSLACQGGVGGPCNKEEGAWSGNSVECAQTAPPIVTVYDPISNLVVQTFPKAQDAGSLRWQGKVCTKGAQLCFGIGTMAWGCGTTDPARWHGEVATFDLSNGVTLNLRTERIKSPPSPPNVPSPSPFMPPPKPARPPPSPKMPPPDSALPPPKVPPTLILAVAQTLPPSSIQPAPYDPATELQEQFSTELLKPTLHTERQPPHLAQPASLTSWTIQLQGGIDPTDILLTGVNTVREELPYMMSAPAAPLVMFALACIALCCCRACVARRRGSSALMRVSDNDYDIDNLDTPEPVRTTKYSRSWKNGRGTRGLSAHEDNSATTY